MKFRNLRSALVILACVPMLLLFQNCGGGEDPSPAPQTPAACTTLNCLTLKYSLLAADLDGSNISVVRTSGYQEMTHPRVSADKNWVAYTAYNDINASGCATLTDGYKNTEIRAVQISGSGDKRIISPVANQLNSNSYWIGATNEFTYLSGPESALKLMRATVNAAMTVVSGPTQIAVSGTIVPLDPATGGTDKIVYAGLYQNGASYYKSIFMMNLSDSSNLVGLSLGRDHAGTPVVCNSGCTTVAENDPKISPNGANVAFMRQVPSGAANGFGFHIFVVPVASPQSEVDISYATWGSDVSKNDALPEWIDNDTLIFSTLEGLGSNDPRNVYTMKSDGSQRTKINLPTGFRYADVYPFSDGSGKMRMIISAEKIGATCSQ
jgi:hypothetical protein